MVCMVFKKISISLPENMIKHSQRLIELGVFSSISDIIRSGLRHEFEHANIIALQIQEEQQDEKYIYNNSDLMNEVLKSAKDVKEGRGLHFKNVDEMKKFLSSL